MEDTRQERNKLIKKARVAEKEAESTERVVEEEEWRDWSSSLTEDLLLLIVSFLVTLADLSSFGAVCRSWRSSTRVVSRLTMSSQSPLLLVCRKGKGKGKGKGNQTKFFFDAIHHRIYKSPLLPYGIRTYRIFDYVHGHFVATPRKRHGPILLVNFFTRAKTKLPDTEDDAFVPDRLLLSSSPSSPDCIAVLLECCYACFLYCRLGDPHWMMYELSSGHWVEDAVFVGNRLYVLFEGGSFGFFRFVPRLEFTRLDANSIINVHCSWRLAESAGDLLAIRCTHKPFGYDIWRWDSEGDSGFVEVSSLGERALFFSSGCGATSLAASVGSRVAGNSIYHSHWAYSLDTKRVTGYISIAFSEYYRYDTKPVWIFPSLC